MWGFSLLLHAKIFDGFLCDGQMTLKAINHTFFKLKQFYDAVFGHCVSIGILLFK